MGFSDNMSVFGVPAVLHKSNMGFIKKEKSLHIFSKYACVY